MKRFLLVAVLIMLSAYGCSRDAITVDGEHISKELFDYALKERLGAHKGMNVKVDEKAIRKSVSDELIAEALLVREAKNRKITVTDAELQSTEKGMMAGKSADEFKENLKKSGLSYDLFIARVRTRLLLSKLMNDLVKDDAITEEQMKQFYSTSQVPFLKPEKVYVKIIQIGTEADANAAAERLKKKEDFDAVANDLVKAGKASATNYGWLEPNTLSPDMAAAMKTAKADTVQGPHKAKDGSFYFFKVKERQSSQVLPFDEAKEQIKAMLLNQKRQETAAQIVEAQRKKTKITINIS